MTKWFPLLLVPLLLIVLPVCAETGAQEPGDNLQVGTPSIKLGAVVVARPGAEEALNLEQCVEFCLQANDRLNAERLRMAELRGQMDQAMATGLPTLDLVGDWTRSRSPVMALDSTFGGDGSSFAPPVGADPWFNDWVAGFGSLIPEANAIEAQTFWTASLNMNWNINPVKIVGAVGAAKLGIRRQEYAVQHLENSTVELTLASYFAIIKAADKILAVQAQIKNQRELLEIMKMRYDLGMSTRLDTLQAAVTLANLSPQLSIARAALSNEGSRLNALMGRSPVSPLQVYNEQVVERVTLDLDSALALATGRPDLAATSLFVDILKRNRQAQGSENLPYLTIGGAYGYVGRTTNTIFDDGHDSWRASVALNIPVFDGMLNRGLVKETKARIRRTEAELSGSVREVQVEVLEIMANLEMAHGVLDAVKLNLHRSEEVLAESLLMLQLGKVNYLDVLVSEANRAEAQSNVIEARYQVLVLTASLKRAVGYSPLVPLTQIPGMVMEVTP